MKQSLSIYWLWLILLAFFSGRAQTVSVPLSHPVYPVIERWDAQGLIPCAFLESQPFTRQEVGHYLEQVWRQYRENPERFSRTDLQDLRYLSREFFEELSPSVQNFLNNQYTPWMSSITGSIFPGFLQRIFYTNHRNMVTLKHGDFSLFLDPVLQSGEQQRVAENGSSYAYRHWSNGLMFRGHLGSYLGFYFNLTDNHVTDGRWPDQKIPYEVLRESGLPYLLRQENGKYDYDENIAYLTLNWKYVYLLYGREYNQWGVGRSGNLMLSTNAPVYDQLKLVIRYWRFKFTHLTAFLQYISPEARYHMKDVPYIPVYWSGNRLDVDLGRGFRLGLAESIIYGDRSLQIGYLNPLTFFKSLEHFYGDRDNGALSVSLSWRFYPGIRWYGEWFIDDMSTGKLGSHFYGNKFGWQTGVFWVNPLGWKDSDVRVEYTRLKPYLYSQSTHDYNKYKHYDTMLGHFIGPNSDDWLVQFQQRFTRYVQIGVVWESYRHGANPEERNVGGDPDKPHQQGDAMDAPFLDGIRYWQHSYGANLRYEPFRQLFLTLQFRRFQWNHEAWQNLWAARISLNFGYRQETFRNIFPVVR